MSRQRPTTGTHYSSPPQTTQAHCLFKSAAAATQNLVLSHLRPGGARPMLRLLWRLIPRPHLVTLDDRTPQVLQPPLRREPRGHSLEVHTMTTRTGTLRYHYRVLRHYLLHHPRDQGALEVTLIQNRVACVRDLRACSSGTVILRQFLALRKVFIQEPLRDPRSFLSESIPVAYLDLERHLS